MAAEVEAASEDRFFIDQHPLSFSEYKTPEEVPWEDLGIDMVLECSGKFRIAGAVSGLFQRGVKKVIVAAPVKQGRAQYCHGHQ